MKKITLFIFSLVYLAVFGQQWEWGRKADATASNESPSKIQADANGNLYLLGYGNGGSKYGNATLAPGDFLVKFDPSGAVAWAKNVVYSGGSNSIQLTVDNEGNIYLWGYYTGNLTMFSFSFTSNGEEDIYLIKLDPSGNPLWGKSFGGPKGDTPGALAADDNQNLYLTGSFNKSISFDGYTLSDSLGHFFLAKLNSSGNAIWATKGDSCFFYGGGVIAFDNHSHVFVAGSACQYQSFIAKFDANGSLLSRYFKLGMYDYIRALAVSDLGNIFLFHNGNGHYSYVPILVKYDSLMNEQWSQTVGTYYGCYQLGEGIYLDQLENVYIGGSVGSEYCGNDSVYFQGQLVYVGHHAVPAIAKFSTLGNLLWVKTAASSADYDGIWTMAQDKSGNLYAAGEFNTYMKGDTLVFNQDKLINDGNWIQIFVAKLNPFANPTLVQENRLDRFFEIFPNPSAGMLMLRMPDRLLPVKVVVRDVLGNCLLERSCSGERGQQIDLTGQPKGIYFVELISGRDRVARKVAVQ